MSPPLALESREILPFPEGAGTDYIDPGNRMTDTYYKDCMSMFLVCDSESWVAYNLLLLTLSLALAIAVAHLFIQYLAERRCTSVIHLNGFERSCKYTVRVTGVNILRLCSSSRSNKFLICFALCYFILQGLWCRLAYWTAVLLSEELWPSHLSRTYGIFSEFRQWKSRL